MVETAEWASMSIDKAIGMTPEELELHMAEELRNGRDETTSSCKPYIRKLPIIGFISGLYDTYDSTFLTMLGMQYFN